MKLLSSSFPPRMFKETLEKSRFYGKNAIYNQKKQTENKLSYTQVSLKNIKEILKIKNNFPELSNKKIKKLSKLVLNNSGKLKLKINMMTKGPS